MCWAISDFRRLFFLLLFFGPIFATACSQRVQVENLDIENFSDINFKEVPEDPYFSNIEYLPYRITLGDYFDHNSILFLNESTNLLPIEDEHLKLFFSSDEIEKTLETYYDDRTESLRRKTNHYPFERIVSRKFVLEVRLVINTRKEDQGREYSFSFRTFDLKGRPIDKITFAKWSDVSKEFFSGVLNPKWEIVLEDEKPLLEGIG